MSETMNGVADPLDTDEIDGVSFEDGALPAEKSRERTVSTEDLRNLLAKERSARTAAEDRAREAERRASTAESKATSEIEGRFNAEVSNVSTALARIDADIGRLEAAADAADDAGDRRAYRDAMRQISRLEAEKLQAEGRKQWLDANKEVILQAGRSQQAKASGGIDLSTFSDRQREWINRHPDYASSVDFREKVRRAHFAALGEGHEIDSDAYFDAIEARIGSAAPASPREEEPSPFSDAHEPQSRQQEMPVHRRPAPPQAPRNNATVRLTPEQREAADITMSHIPTGDATGYYVENGEKKPGRYRIYYENTGKN